MVETDQGIEIYDNDIESLFYEYCMDNNIDLKDRYINDIDATCIFKYIYKRLFKPDNDTIRYNNKTSKLDYGDIYKLHEVLDIYLDLCFKYKILPLISDFCDMTGISRDTLNSWEHGEYRAAAENASCKHSEIAKKIKEATKRMTLKNLNGSQMGQMALANNFDEAGLMFARAEAQAKADAWLVPRERPQEIIARRSVAIPQKPDMN